MTRYTITLPKPIAEYIDRRLAEGAFASLNDYVADLVDRDINQRRQAETELRGLLDEAEESGISERGVRDVFEYARSPARKPSGVL
ncbi:type II toxin-antitoxin system ParD family antitoxin [Rhizobium sp. LjRoot30]|uniref:ribbon-helix-helix domain-containing protein n=1 Tax=Rhizobium sp. LjRoot30 TaxID=3342320 RepID=UPI003ED05FF6